MPPPAIPVTVIGGYLGAGKTTLVNHLLRHADGLRLAVLVNEFGELPIDADLIESVEENVINIAGGCVCCSYGSDLIAALQDLERLETAPDHLLIEASGVALPEAIAQSVTLIARYAVDGIVVLADAETVRRHGSDKYLADTIENQLATADLVLLNKTDLAPPGALEETRRWLDGACGGAPVVETENAAAGLPVVLGARLDETRGFASGTPHTHHSAATLSLDGPADPQKLAAVLADPRFDLVRSKGFATGLDGLVYAVQTVGRRHRVTRAAEQPAAVGRIVCIRSAGAVDLDALSEAVSSLRAAVS